MNHKYILKNKKTNLYYNFTASYNIENAEILYFYNYEKNSGKAYWNINSYFYTAYLGDYEIILYEHELRKYKLQKIQNICF